MKTSRSKALEWWNTLSDEKKDELTSSYSKTVGMHRSKESLTGREIEEIWSNYNRLNQDNYYMSELNRINFNSNYSPTFQFKDSEGNMTKNLNLNKESATALKQWIDLNFDKLKN